MNKILLTSLKDSHEISKKLERVTNTSSEEYLDINAQIIPDKKVSLGNFKRSHLNPNIYYAHPQTIRALKKNIFFTDKEFEDLEEIIHCSSCKKQVDKQFWHFCPYCEKKFESSY